jgi:hypothetical protein
MRRRIRTVLVTSIVSAVVLGLAPASFAGPLPEGCQKDRGTIHCTEEGKNKNWTTETSKKGSFSSSHEQQDTNRNKGGNVPPGQN